jgi:hypothetical protein
MRGLAVVGNTGPLPEADITLDEGGLGWVAMLADRADFVLAHSGSGQEGGSWKGDLLPSEVLRRNFWFCSIDDPSAFRALDAIGAERILVESDYPHSTKIRLSFLSGFVLDGLPGWRETMHLPVPERLRALADLEVRRRLDDGAHSEEAGILRALANWERLIIVETFAPENTVATGRTVGEVAEARGGGPFDTLLDVVIADELRTGLSPRPFGDDEADWQARAEVWRNRDAVIGGSDAGAHLDMMCGAIYTTSLLGHGVREHQVVTLEEAVRLITDVPARLYGLKERGRITPGWHADLVMFDPATVDHGPERTRYDLPAGAPRLVADARGITSVWVGGVEVCRDGKATGAMPGTVLRSGRDTETVAAS